MEALKEKYGIDEEAILEIADSLEPDAEAPAFVSTGDEGDRAPPKREALPSSLASAMRGDIGIGEAIILMDYMDRKEDRRERRYPPNPKTSINEDLLKELREERKENREYLEKVIMRQRTEDAESRAKTAEQALEDAESAQRQKDAIEGAVRGAVDQIGEVYGVQLDALASRVSDLPPNQQNDFLSELFTDYETDLKSQFKDMILNRLKPPEKPVVKVDEEGKSSINWQGLLDRGEGILDKFLDTRKQPPPKVPVDEVPLKPEVPPRPLSEGPAPLVEPVEVEPEVVEEEQPSEAPVVLSPIPPQDITGIGPSRALELADMGITDARQLTQISPSHLSDQLGISKEKAEDMVAQAKDLIDQA